MSIIRNRITKKFTTIPNLIILDGKLSHGAFRVYAYLLSKPNGWKVINSDIQKQLNIRQTQTLSNYWKELISLGWISRCRAKNDSGKIIGGFDYELNERPVTQDVEVTNLGNNHNMENPQCGKTINRENTQYINNTKEQEQNKTNSTNPPTLTLSTDSAVCKTDTGVIGVWLDQVKRLDCQFTSYELQAIGEWAKYKYSITKSISVQQIEITLKSLKVHKEANFDIVYMIHQSIIGNYRKIMDPTNACIAKPMATTVNRTYLGKDYIVPRTENEKNELWDYLKCCYMNQKDPRTGQLMTKEQIQHIGKHFRLGLSQGINQDRYIYINEVETNISLLEQNIGQYNWAD